MKLREIRAKEGGRKYTVVDGEPQSGDEINRAGADALVAGGIYGPVFESDDGAAAELIARGDYEEVAEKKVKAEPAEPAKARKPRK